MNVVLASILLAAFLPLHAENNKRDIRLVEAKGSVWVKPSGGEWEVVDTKNFEELPLEEGEGIKTGSEPSEATIQIDQENTVELSPDTEFEVTSSNLAWTKFRLFTGRILSKIEEKIAEKKRNMNVLLPASTLAVRGTEFAADASGEDDVGGLGVFEGEVEATLNNLEGSPAVKVKAGQELDFIRKGAPPKPRAIRRFKAMKKRMAFMRKRHAQLRAKWRSMPHERRRAIRQKVKELRRERRQQLKGGDRNGPGPQRRGMRKRQQKSGPHPR
ncbi:MAG: FecR domain-containing protein [Elusimicrobia bacterium]|nr:FecR domain-containing protein [Elusimicrobiota bacterium]